MEDAVYWVSAADGKILHVLKASETPDGYISQAFPVDGIRLLDSSEVIALFFTMWRPRKLRRKDSLLISNTQPLLLLHIPPLR